MGGKPSQRKGRGGEHELASILVAAGYDARVKGIYEPFDVDWEGRDCEVKREKGGMTKARKALKAGCRAFFHRADRDAWTITLYLRDYLYDHGPAVVITEKGIEALQELADDLNGDDAA